MKTRVLKEIWLCNACVIYLCDCVIACSGTFIRQLCASYEASINTSLLPLKFPFFTFSTIFCENVSIFSSVIYHHEIPGHLVMMFCRKSHQHIGYVSRSLIVNDFRIYFSYGKCSRIYHVHCPEKHCMCQS